MSPRVSKLGNAAVLVWFGNESDRDAWLARNQEYVDGSDRKSVGRDRESEVSENPPNDI